MTELKVLKLYCSTAIYNMQCIKHIGAHVTGCPGYRGFWAKATGTSSKVNYKLTRDFFSFEMKKIEYYSAFTAGPMHYPDSEHI